MGSTEAAGVVAQPNWNPESGMSSAALLVDQNGATSGAAVIWNTNGIWSEPISNSPGNDRLMLGYLDTTGGPTTVTVAGLLANAGGYNVYVYAEGANGGGTRTGAYQIRGSGITTTSVNLSQVGSTDFTGTFTQANNSAGNYVVLPISSGATGFTITATPGATTDIPRAPLNAIQIVPQGTIATYTLGGMISGLTSSGLLLANNGGLVLAIVVTGFTGREDGTDVVLNWNTASGQTGTSFIVQRSTDGGQFASIGKTEGSISQAYSFTDANPNPGKNFYRVEIIAANGEIDYTSIVEEDFAESTSVSAISVFPNPVVNQFTVRFSTEAGLPYTVDIFDRSGKKMQSGQWLSGSGEIQVALAKRFTAGIYMIRVSGPRNLTSEIAIQ